MADQIDSSYEGTWKALFMKKLNLMGQRSTLEAELSEVKTQIAHLDEILSHLGPLAGVPEKDNIASLGITDAVRWILKNSEMRMSPTDVRDKLAEKGFDLSALTAPMGSIYKILSRLADATPPEITREREEGGRNVFYRWNVSTSDIPF